MGSFASYGTEVVALDTFRSVHSKSTSYRSMGDLESSTTEEWEPAALRGTFAWSVGATSFCPARRRKPTPTILALEVDETFLQKAWESAPIDSCSTQFDAQVGVALNGPRAKIKLRTLVAKVTRIGASDVLFVEIEPDAGAQLPTDAVLRICTSEMPMGPGYCSPMPVPQCATFRLDGTLVSGKLTAARSPSRTRFMIPLPEPHDALTVSYMEPKSGRSLSSSRFLQRDTTVMSTLKEFTARFATCNIEGGALRFVRPSEGL
jgi:hypothetical protein